MLFPTFTFLFGFLPLTVIVYFLLSCRSRIASQVWLVLASFVFYSWFNWSYSLILGGSLLMNWIFAQLLYQKQSKLILALGIICNVLLLGYFKYYDFFIENINALFQTSFLLKHILLPLGISFFTFQQISFLQLVYSRSMKKRYSFGSYALFVCFFPQLIAGPIVLPDEMMSQFDKDDCLRPDARNIAAGLYLFALGMSNQNHRLSRWYAPRLQGEDTGKPDMGSENSSVATTALPTQMCLCRSSTSNSHQWCF